jgi:hypothetical protein
MPSIRRILLAAGVVVVAVACGETPAAPSADAYGELSAAKPSGGGSTGDACVPGSGVSMQVLSLPVSGYNAYASGLGTAGTAVGRMSQAPASGKNSYTDTLRAVVWESGTGQTLPTPAGMGYAEAADANDVVGVILGAVWPYGVTGQRPVAWRRSAGGWTVDDLLPTGTESEFAAAVAANDDGSAVGHLKRPGESYEGQVWTLVNGMYGDPQPIPRIAGYPETFPASINSAGFIAGNSADYSVPGYPSAAWVMTPSGSPQVLQTVEGATQTAGYDVNDDGIVVGRAIIPATKRTPMRSYSVRWTPAAGAYESPEILMDGGWASAVRNDGVVVGQRLVSDGTRGGLTMCAYVWWPDTRQVTMLGTLDRGPSRARAVSEGSPIVVAGSAGGHAVLWTVQR